MIKKLDTILTEMSDPAIIEMVGEFVKATRLRQNKTQEQLEFESGIDRMTIIRIENGKGGNLSTLIALLRSLEQLNLLEVFKTTPQVSPLALAKLEQKQRQRAARTKPSSKRKKSDW